MPKKKITAKAGTVANLKTRATREATRYSPALLGKLSNSELAQQIAGTSDKKSKEYKAAMRNLQRYKKGDRRPQKKTVEKIERAARKIVKAKPEAAQKLFGSGTVTASGVIGYSSEARRRTIHVRLSGSAMADFLANPNQDSLFEFYGVPGMFMQSGTVSVEFDR